MTCVKQLCRAATRIQRAWLCRLQRAAHAEQEYLERLAGRCQALLRRRRSLRKARSHDLDLTADKIRADLRDWLRGVREALDDADESLRRPSPRVPRLAELVDELRQAEAEFGGLTVAWKEKYVAVVTEPITLEEVYLGPFELRLPWERLVQRADGFCFEVVALEPNPAQANPGVTHPHVRSRQVCAGDATLPLQRALEAGRLADAFQLVHGVLRQYNPASPHVRLEEWGGPSCYDCGRRLHEDGAYFCEGCSRDYCESCSTSCPGCDSTRCPACLEPCAVCDEGFWRGCLRPSAHSPRRCCGNCLASCAACRARVAKDEITPETGLCPTCHAARRPAPDPSTSLPTPIPHASTTEEPHAPSPPSPVAAA
jgi:hypothetical protein